MVTLKSYTDWYVIYSDMLFYLFWILSIYFYLGHLFTYYWNRLSKSKFTSHSKASDFSSSGAFPQTSN